jgi:hypothetical protein
MFSSSFGRATVFGAMTVAALVAPVSPARAQSKNPVQKAGKYSVELRLPAAGVAAGEEIDIEFRVGDTSREDAVNGVPGVVRAKIDGVVTMPSMASMPAVKPKIHSEGVPGDYGLVTRFPHGGDYLITLNITPPGEGVEPFTVSFPVSVKDAKEKGAKEQKVEAPYTLEVKSNPPRPILGQPAVLTIAVKDRATGQRVTKFDEVHTMLMHLFVVREDLGAFSHEHPEPNADGTFTLNYTFLNGGEWRIFADCAPQDAGSQVISTKVIVDGVRAPRAFLAVPTNTVVREAGYTLTLKNQRLPAKESQMLTFELRDNQGQPVTDMDLWLGALAHLILIEKDVQTFVHSHPDESDPRNGRGGTLTFMARFPKAGTYKGWLQFKRQGNIFTIPFVVRATGG